jgi:KUP system potassium uptake protein
MAWTSPLHNLKHNKVLHHTMLLIRVVTENIPRVASADRIKARELGSGFWQIEAQFRFCPDPECTTGAEPGGDRRAGTRPE